jgi:hypothetical protein
VGKILIHDVISEAMPREIYSFLPFPFSSKIIPSKNEN